MRRLFSVLYLCGHLSTISYDDITHTKKRILTTLEHKNPQLIAEMNQLFSRYDKLVIAFFDTANHEPFCTHIKHMEHELRTLNRVYHDDKFKDIKLLLTDHYKNVVELISVLKEYNHSHHALSLAFKVRRFKCLLPRTLQEKNDITLFWALRHRLYC